MQCLEFDSALVVLKKAKMLNLEVSKGNNQLTTLILNHLATTYLELGDFKKSEDKLYESIKIAKDLFGEKDADLAESYYLLAESKVEQKEYTNALEQLIKAEEALILTTFNNLEYDEEIISRTLLLSIYILKEEILWKQYNRTKDAIYLNELYKATIKSSKLSNDLVNFYEHENAKLEVFKAINENLYLGILASKELYDKSKDEKYIEQALRFFEFEKSFLLKQEYRNLKAKQNTQIPDSLLLIENRLKCAVSDEQNLLFSQNNPNSDDSKKISTKIFNLKVELSEFLGQMEMDYPQYYNQKYQNIDLDIKLLQEGLNRNELLLEYFQYQDEVFSISIDKENLHFEKTTIANLDTKINKYNKAIENSSIELYSDIAFEFYTNIVKDHLYNDSINQLTIVPSKSISYLSFDTFLTSKPTDLKYNKLDYLLLKISISYKNSLQKTQRNTEVAKETYLGICPEFSNKDEQHLKGALKEVTYISKKYDGTVLSDKTNLKKNLLLKLSDYKIVHFATHASLDELDSKYSSLLLSSDTLKENKLYAYEIQNTKINAELVILSACNTGLGTLKTGEGLASLARSFNYAGAQSVLLGLWALPDLATSKIIQHFSTGLIKEKKGRALRKAKMSYLENSDEHTANPRYWGGLILIGEDQSLDLKLNVDKSTNYLLYFGLLTFIALVLFGRKLI